jgi:hypothetical protein
VKVNCDIFLFIKGNFRGGGVVVVCFYVFFLCFAGMLFGGGVFICLFLVLLLHIKDEMSKIQFLNNEAIHMIFIE